MRPCFDMTWIGVGVALTLFVCADARAEEVICDPENPACVADPEPEPAGGALDEEVICDPENPACQQPGEGSEAGDEGGGQLTAPDFSEVDEPQVTGALVRGSWGTSLGVDTAWQGDREDVFEVGSGVDILTSVELSASTKVVLSGQLRHWMGAKRRAPESASWLEGSSGRGALDVRLGESYVQWSKGAYFMRAGNLVTSWGATDLTRPADVINPKDQRSFGQVGPAAQDGVLAQPSIEAGVGAGGVKLTGVFVPFFVPDQVVLFGRDNALAGPRSPLAQSFPVVGLLERVIDPSSWEQTQGLASSLAYPDEGVNHPSLGGRLSTTLANTDLGVGYFWGWDRTPMTFVDPDAAQLARILTEDEEFFQDFDFLALARRNPELFMLTERLSEKQAAGEEIFVTEYRRRHTLALDVARYIGPIGVRADVALSPAQTFATLELASVRRPTASGALGLSYERVSGERQLAITLEGFAIKPASASGGVTQRFVSDEGERGVGLEPVVIGDGLYGVAGGVVWDIPVVRANLTVGGVYNVSTRDWIARAQLRRGLTDQLFLNLGGVVFEGPPPSESFTLGGLYDNNDSAWFGLDGVF